MKRLSISLFLIPAFIALLAAFPSQSMAADEDIAPYMAKADAAKGKTTAQACAMCHSFEKGGANKLGPALWGVVGSERATHAGFAYSTALTAMKGQKWTEQDLSNFITNPMAYAKGTKMAFAGVKNPQDRANVIAWLATLKDAK